jgi:hypothetical protein
VVTVRAKTIIEPWAKTTVEEEDENYDIEEEDEDAYDHQLQLEYVNQRFQPLAKPEPAVLLRLTTSHSEVVIRLPDAEAVARGLPLDQDYFLRGRIVVPMDERTEIFRWDDYEHFWYSVPFIEEKEFVVPVRWLWSLDELSGWEKDEWKRAQQQLAQGHDAGAVVTDRQE